MNRKRIVITGIGIVSPIGIGKEAYWKALRDGKSGIKKIKRFDTKDFKCKMAGEINNFKAAELLGEKDLNWLDRTTRFLCYAAKSAILDSGLDINDSNTDEIGVSTGTTFSSLWNIAEYDSQVIKEGPLFTDPAVFAGTVVNAASSHVSIRHNIQGFNATISSDYTSSFSALKYAVDAINIGRAKAVVVGGAESISLVNFSGFYKAEFLAGINGEEISCPFDKRRNGIVLSEGAGVIIIEDEEYAKKHNANILAEIGGVAINFDAYRLGKYQPQAIGLKSSISSVLNKTGINPDDIDCICASGNSVTEQDYLEAKTIKGLFNKNIPVTAIKSMIGEPFSASGIMQLIASLGYLNDRLIFPTINYKDADSECDIHIVRDVIRMPRIKHILVNNFGPCGNSAACVVSQY